ncbi:hypothetical protein GUITHDRAFT_147491 [Guillardia theta CCMP2712]|uniref:Tyrosine-protein kinase ephrin type A/B receptor-like domain-containing protein n=1 Tax=Guillardia theta (strain CCMP2712) TaxID=905079 RepID=L1ID58_GUITC|nr:hypothetical protein GUITHDRAFT_147491 [Guillardia theta CCMP2712]EKX34032.1 hypothetical protein GUITHDRAFT_147491 [Guillardia theta CCMP2712]|eukprot:XP_005821012.1 hypothetical protein GUITHDRAFT_147491 [Guillardia theta CCMP2712]
MRINGSSLNTSSCPSLLARVQVSYTPACRPWPEGSYAGVNSSSCQACPAPSTSPVGSIAQDNCTCQAGYTGKNISDCQGCPAGQFKGLMGFQACDDCPVGTYSLLEGSSACTNCLVGMTSVGATSSCICAGGYVFEAAFRCFPCPAGSFKNVTGNGTCRSVCGDGTYASSNGTVRSSVPPAPRDRTERNPPNYTETDAVNCQDCFPHSSTAAPGMTACAQCNPGYFSHIASSECTVDVVDVLAEVFTSGDVDAFTLDLQGNLTETFDRQQFLRDFNASHVFNIVFTEQCGAGRQRNTTGGCEACPVGTFKNASDDSHSSLKSSMVLNTVLCGV